MSEAFRNGFLRGLGMPVGWLLCNICYGIGHAISRAMQFRDWEWPAELLYPVYNRMMLWSLRINDAFGLSLWKENANE